MSDEQIEAFFQVLAQIASALNRLGVADACTPMGALEIVSLSIKEAGDAIGGGLSEVATAVRELADAIGAEGAAK